jgi:hypothetical protein
VKAKDLKLAYKLRKYGIKHPFKTVAEARRAGITVPLAAAMLEQESGNGANVFGHDPTIFAGAGTVTKKKYLAYKAKRKASGNRLMQGVGPLQLTWWATQDRADALGGAWKPEINMRVGFATLASLIKAYGYHNGLARYNGSGPAAQRYADSVTAKHKKWHDRLT